MTTVEEDLLLNEPAAHDFDENLAVIDEDLLLGADNDNARKSTLISAEDSDGLLLDEDAVEHAPEQDPEQVPAEKDEAEESEHEELDYDEEEEEEDDSDKRERTSRYTSEKRGGTNRQNSDDSKKENGHAKSKRIPGIPSLFDKKITNNPMKSGGDMPIGVVLRIEGEAERIFYPPQSFFQQNPIVPRLPNGIPLVGMPPNHGRAGFGQGFEHGPPPAQQQRLAGGGGAPPGGQWDNEVERFLSTTNPSGRRHQEKRTSRKRRSSSYSSESSYSSSSRSRSRSRSNSRDRRRRDDRRRRRDDRENRRDTRRGDRERRDAPRRRHDDRRDTYSDRRRKEQSKQATMESAKALGLSNDYMDQVNEQKRRREEILRKKEERRHAPSGSSVVASSHHPSTSSVSKEKEKAMKAFLAVNVSGVQQLPTAVKKIEGLALELGPIKKCWRSSDDVVSIIFNAHDKAKDFMLKYNGKVLSGLRVNVALEKKFLNLNELN